MKFTSHLLVSVAALAVIAVPAHAQHEGHGAMGDSAAVAAVVARYTDALTRGDSATALALLSDDAVILESGGIETRAEYRSHHLPADINASKAAPGQRAPVHVRVHGEVAWTTTTSSRQRQVNGNTVTSSMAELMVLVKTAAGWKISAIHWSTRSPRS
ncbi:MAG TPA: nuclear transport factor 2 family protein [Gemmatimonadaceae bacterium]